jgi:hypothetical protein
MPIGLYLKPIYNLTLVQLMVVNQVPGDYNLNGVVDAADFVVWRKSDNSPGGYSLWRTNFGLTAAAAAASATANIAVPEANSLLLCWIAIALLCGHGVSKRRAYRSSLKYTLNEPSPALPPRGREYEKSVVKGMGVGYLIRRYLCQRIPRARPESALAA